MILFSHISFKYNSPNKFIFFVFSVVLYCNTALICVAQHAKMDSLKKVLLSAREDTNKVNILNGLSKCNWQEGNYEEANKYATEALALAERTNFKKGKANACNNKGLIFWRLGNYPEALKNNFTNLKISEEIGYKLGIARAYMNIGNIYGEQKNYPEAVKNYFACLKITKELGEKHGIALAYNNIGVSYNAQKIFPEALKNFFLCLKISQEQGDKVLIALSSANIASVYLDEGRYSEALQYGFASEKVYQEVGDKNGFVWIYNILGNTYIKLKDMPNAEKYLKEGLALAKEIKSQDDLEMSYDALAKLDSARGDFKGALEYYKLSTIAKDSILNEKSAKQTNEMRARYETEKKEQQILLLNKEKEKQVVEAAAESKRQRLIIYFIAILALSAIIFGVVIFRSLKITRNQKRIIDEKNLKITDSISYAQKIQEAILPKDELLKNLFSDSFIFFRPKDIVSGDFYWLGDKGDKKIFAVVDCTGHGVPGAFMSMIGNALLNEIVNDEGIEEPDEILNHLREKVIHSLKQSDEGEANDGMEIALCVLDKSKNLLYFSGAKNSIYHFRQGVLNEYKGDKQSISFERGKEEPFTKHVIEIQEGDTIYLFTDGFADQKGGEEKRKFYYNPFQQLLAAIQQEPMTKQQSILLDTFNKWKGNIEQVDDLLVMGVRI